MLLKKPEIIIKSLLKNGLSLVAIRGTILLSSMVVTLLLVRSLGSASFGSYITASKLYALFLPFILLGVGNVIIREVAGRPDLSWKYFTTALYSGILPSILAAAAVNLLCAHIGYSGLIKKAALILALGLYPNFVIQVSESLLIGLEKVKYFAVVQFISAFLEAALIAWFLTHGHKVYSVVTILVILRYAFAFTLTVIILNLTGAEHSGFDLKFAVSIYRTALVFAVAGILSGCLFQIDVLFLSRLAGPHEAGIYSAAYKLVNLWNMLISSFIGVFYPVASRYHSVFPEKFEEICQIMMRCILLLAFFAVLATLSLSREVILLFFNYHYVESIAVLRHLIFLLIPMCLTPMLGLILAASHHQKWDLAAIAAATASSFLLHNFLVRHFSYFGSVYANILTFSIIQTIQLYFINRFVFKVRIFENLIKPLAIFITALAALYAMQEWAWYVKAPVCLLIYSALIPILKLVRRDEIRLFLNRS